MQNWIKIKEEFTFEVMETTQKGNYKKMVHKIRLQITPIIKHLTEIFTQ